MACDLLERSSVVSELAGIFVTLLQVLVSRHKSCITLLNSLKHLNPFSFQF